jgi:serine protease Do
VTLTSLDVTATPPPRGQPEKPAAPASGNPLGLAVEPLDAAARAALGLEAGEGVLVARVEGLAARRAGIAPGDVVLRVGRQDVGSVEQFDAAVKGLEPGDEVRLLVRNARSTGFVAFTVR